MREPMRLAPVTVTAETVPAVAVAASGPVGRMEIVLGAGDRVIVGSDVDTMALARVIITIVKVPARRALLLVR